MRFILTSLFLFSFCSYCWAQDLPEGFQIEEFATDLNSPAGTVHAHNGLIYFWELGGKVWVLEDGVKGSEPVIDISEEVAYYGDLGLLGLELDPDFENNGYIYLLYVVDGYYLENYGSSDYDSEESWEHYPTIGRLTRYELSTIDYQSIVPDSRMILLGETVDDGVPVLTNTHSVGNIIFGDDGSLLLSTGDGSIGYNGGDWDVELNYDSTALANGQLSELDNVRSYRSQLIQTLNGKILRINPETGEGYPSNPFFDDENPNSAQSKVWALGLRNPFRVTHKPGSGLGDPSAGVPGDIFIGDVGSWLWEELNVCDGPGQNFGWPRYEGNLQNWEFNGLPMYNKYWENPFYDGVSCTDQYYYFRELIQDPNAFHEYHFPNPCDGVEEIDNAITHIHKQPTIAYMNSLIDEEITTFVPGYDNEGNFEAIPIDESSVGAAQFVGYSSLGGVFYNGTSLPEEYFGAYFHIDLSGWIKVMKFDENNELLSVEDFANSLFGQVHINVGPFDGALYITDTFLGKIYKISFAGNLSPVVIASADQTYGLSPLTVNFGATESYDPDNDPILFSWDFGDGQTSNDVSPIHTFVGNNNEPTSFDVTLTVTDSEGNFTIENFLISTNNTPPVVDITSVSDGDLYALDSATMVLLQASVYDQEHLGSELAYEWQTFFHHNTHYHPEPIDVNVESSFLINPLGCDNLEEYYYRFKLTVTDSEGLSSFSEKNMYPDCDGLLGENPVEFSEFVIYPNPTSDFVNLRGPFTNDKIEIAIYDITGANVLFNEVSTLDTDVLTIDLRTLQAGVYSLKILDDQEYFNRLILN